MMLSRRNLLKTIGTAAGAVAATRMFASPLWFFPRIEAASLGTDFAALAPAIDEFKTLADVTFDLARALGCSYADIEIQRGRLWSGLCGDTMNDVAAVIEIERSHLDVRVFHSGGWGAASQTFAMDSPSFKKVEAARLTARAVVAAQANAALTERRDVFAPLRDWEDCWSTPQQNDQCAALIRDQLDRIEDGTAVKSMWNRNSRLMLRTEEKFFNSSKGSCTHSGSISVT